MCVCVPPLSPPNPQTLTHLVAEGVDPLLQVAIFRVQQRRLLGLEGAVGVGVLPKLADHGELGRRQRGRQRKTEGGRDTGREDPAGYG